MALERALPDVTDAQHIYNKLVYDSVNEALLNIYKQCNRIKVSLGLGAECEASTGSTR